MVLVQAKTLTNIERFQKEFFEAGDSRFGKDLLSVQGVVEVSLRYNHNNALGMFFEKILRGPFFYRGPAFRDENLSKVSHKLVPGKEYLVSLFPILSPEVTMDDCIEFLKKKNALFVGAQGIVFLQEHYPELLPVQKYLLSLDEKKNLWVDEKKNHRVPGILKGKHDQVNWYRMEYYGDACFPDRILVCFREL